MRQNRTYQLLSKNSIRLLLLQFLLLAGLQTNAQIKIAGNVYGGGNAGDVGGNATVSVHEGDLKYLYGGARMANVGGWAFVDINATSNLLISVVYGGNDISGTIGSSTSIPLTPIVNTADKAYIDNSFNSFIRTREAENKHLFIGRLFGGGNGDYTYTPSGTGIYDVTTKVGENTVTLATNVNKPDLSKTYLELMGGTIAHAYGGGNNVTVTDNTSICIDNASPVTTSMKKPNGEELLTDARMSEMGLNSYQTQVSSSDFQFGRVFGGNNKADMSIRPKWFLRKGQIRDLYSGGNEGNMTSTDGLLLEILADSEVKVDNIYGGCRKANVIPGGDLAHPGQATDLEGYLFPKGVGLSARVLVRGGDINNVYGGNDISGKVYGGNAIGVYTSIRGDIYGGGNGSYPYTDKAEYETDPVYGDFYYDPGSSSVDALNAFRPNAEQVSIRVAGTEAKKTVIGGAIFLGGNSATMSTTKPNPMVELKIGSYVIADNVFLGNNGANMVNSDVAVTDDGGHVTKREGVLRTLKTVNSMTLSEGDVFNKYMEGCAMTLMPSVVFDDEQKGDPATYIPYSTYIGSFYCGGNVGSMVMNGKIKIDFKHQVIIYNKVVGGCNNANVPAVDGINAAYEGGILGSAETSTGDKLELNLEGLKIQPKRWKDETNKTLGLEWNTYIGDNKVQIASDEPIGTASDNDKNRRFKGGNIYGGCYNSGHVNGNVVINLNASIVDRKGEYSVFDIIQVDNEGEALLYGNDNYQIIERRSGVILDNQGMDVLGKALNVFGGGYGPESEIWGSTTINLNKGYTFQIFGGGEQGVIGKPNDGEGDDPLSITFNGKTYQYNSKYSTTINLSGAYPGVYRGHTDDKDDMAEAEFIYGGAFIGPIAGNTQINLGNGRIFNSFAGSCNADILGHTETYVGRNGNNDTQTGFPYVRDHIYGGNDLGGRILGEADFMDRVNSSAQSMVYNPKGKIVSETDSSPAPDVVKASAYTEFIQGRVNYIFGGCYGVYDYKDPHFKDYTYTTDAEGTTAANLGTARPGFIKPRLNNAFINFKPISNQKSSVAKIYGAGQGISADSDRDIMQNRSYILIDAQQDMPSLEVFGAGDYSGLGMYKKDANNDPIGIAPETAKANADGVTAAAVIDLVRGKIAAAYGGSYNEGITRRTIVNVPENSTININNIFGGAYGTQILPPCDVYESNVNYRNTSENALTGTIYGGNNNERRTLYATVNISSPVWSDKTNGYLAKVFGAGRGVDSWSEYTEVNLESGAKVYEVYGGGQLGHVLSSESIQKYMQLYKEKPSAQISHDDPNWSKPERWDGEVGTGTLKSDWRSKWLEDWKAAWSIPGYYDSRREFTAYVTNENVNLSNSTIVRTAEIDDRANVASDSPIYKKYNTNVIINEGATVVNYAYGGGWGEAATPLSGDVYGTTYIALLGGTVNKDIYAAGTSGAVYNLFDAENFTASTTAYIGGGTARNVYGGGWEGSVGHHAGSLSDSSDNDIFGETHVVIGIRKDQTSLPDGYGYKKGVPAILRNVYGGGEGGAVYGTTHMTINNGYIGYYYDSDDKQYKEKLHDETWSDDTHPKGSDNFRLEDCGNIYGGGYDDNSNVDYSAITIWGGLIRNSVYGGGEIATIGRGSTKEAGTMRTLNAIYHDGTTKVEMYNGHVLRDVYGGGKGYNLLGYGHKADQEKRYTDGYVFGQTAVYIYGGEIGTVEGIADGYGNVFGGGNVGYVYSPSYVVDKTKNEKSSHPNGSDGCSPNHWYYYGSDGNLSEDCKVIVSPMLQVKPGNTVNGKEAYEYVETSYLNTLQKSSDVWANLFTGGKLDNGDPDPNDPERGVMIHNAVFAGGNVASNSDQTYANATTVYGNTTATLYDVYHRDFITVGTEHTGGLYGGGNLSMVDGYRELNITNYGTDFYRLQTRIELDEYKKLSNRERAYFKLQYVCTRDESDPIEIDGVRYDKNHAPIDEDVYQKWIDASKTTTWEGPSTETIIAAFTPYGFCSIYAGRLLNTIQRADLCGVFGSRLVLQGAKDRVAEVGDATEYTINRVGELSLNLQRTSAGDTGEDALHGNYFGIYSVVNRLGNLTSDVRFDDETNHPYRDKDGTEIADKSYLDYKAANPTSIKRNIGTSYNKVALASGVFLEMTTEKSTDTKKDYGYITGVVELDLINVKRDQVGGGFVYAKNQHGVATYNSYITNKILSKYNSLSENEACTYKQYTYSTDLKTYQTSGNFIHPTKRIVDDCYPVNNAYDSDKSPYSEAHYWYVKGDVYIYDVNVSAYTGSANAYSKEVKIPLTITAASHGRLKLMNVKPNLYAYDALDETDNTTHKIGSSEQYNKAFVNGASDSYELNDVITWWDWHNLKQSEQNLFRKETFVNSVSCNISTDGGTPVFYEAGTYVMDSGDLAAFKTLTHEFTDAEGNTILDGNGNPATTDYIFRQSNNISHNTGYVLTFDMSSPKIWDDWYSPLSRKKGEADNDSYFNSLDDTNRTQAEASGYIVGPTFKTNTAGVYGKRHYTAGEIITEDTYNNYVTQPGITPEQKAVMKEAYVATKTVTYSSGTSMKTVNKGSAISVTEYNSLDETTQASFGNAYVCINTLKLDNENYLLLNDLIAASEITTLKTNYPTLSGEIDKALTPAYIIMSAGDYGGKFYDTSTNYSAINGWSSLNATDRSKFIYNYDAFDTLSDPNYLDFYDSSNKKTTSEAYKSPYSDQVDVEYDAVFQPDAYEHDKGEGKRSLTYGGLTVDETHPRISSQQYETIIKNDQRHYTRVKTDRDGETVYFAKDNFDYQGVPYGKGQVVDDPDVQSLTSLVEYKTFATAGEHYYCYEDYENASGQQISKGSILGKGDYDGLTNDQKYFIIQGKEPTGVTTLYVSSESDIKDLTKEKIITVVYQYNYYEDEDDGGIKYTNELHVVNIHLQLESGLPRIGELAPPPTVLPGYTVGLTAPKVDPGLYEPMGNGWEIFASEEEAVNHRNGTEFDNGNTPVYWYQNEKAWVAFYSKNYLGKTYSNPVPIRVANYHDLDAVMKDKTHHMYVDHPGVVRNSKIYIDNRACESDATKSELDLLKDFFDLSITPSDGHTALDSHVKGCADLEFILNSDVSPKKYASNWTSIGTDAQCFEGNLHGDGHTVSGLNNSLFGQLCGNVYNLGVTGSFTSAGVADGGDGYVENCWVKSSANSVASGVRAVFGNPNAASSIKQIVNCYYPVTNTYSTNDTDSHGLANPMPEEAFYNGTVAYNLNGFYLYKRYCDKKLTSGTTSYQYYNVGDNNSLSELQTGFYTDNKTLCSSGVEGGKYVEDRLIDGDFRYASGTIPESKEERAYTDPNTHETSFYPIWPDDYLYFGQMLTYGWEETRPHEDLPSHLYKSNNRLVEGDQNNRVYRAPAYYGNATMSAAHFNSKVNLVAYSKPKTPTDQNLKAAYPNMTAIDFYGYDSETKGTSPYKLGLDGSNFYAPLLDEDGLQSIVNRDETQNLLVYASTSNAKTYNVLNSYFVDPKFSDYYTASDKYQRVTSASIASASVFGHLVLRNGDAFTTDRDHLLVDKQDFNCPIAYTMGADKRMWYQREPDNYVTITNNDKTIGWEGLCLPFAAELVSTQDKGEITHFYGDSKTGHEYWLREYKGGSVSGNEFVGKFNAIASGGNTKNYTNTYLWDTYYSHDDNDHATVDNDKNGDAYQQENYQQGYYSTTHNYTSYPYNAVGTPYLVGFPGASYYEFDLSGNWTPQNRYQNVTIANPGRQTISFVSKESGTGEKAVTIGVSDTELVTGKNTATADGYTYVPNYKNKKLETENTAFVLASDGGSYVKNAENAIVSAFRPYIVVAGSATTRGTEPKENVERVVFDNDSPQILLPKDDRSKNLNDGTMDIYAKRNKVVVESNLRYVTDVRIVNVAGMTLSSFSIEPGESIETRVETSGVYIVYADNGKYVKKVIVK